MSHKALDWVWTQPVRGTRQHVLLALAKKARPKTEQASPSMPELIEMTGLGESTIRGHLQALAEMGIIRAEVSNGGRHKRSTYTLMIGSTAESGSPTPQELRGNEGGPTPQELDRTAPETPQELRRNPPGAGPVVLRTNGGTRGRRDGAAVAPPAALTDDDYPTDDGGFFPEPVTPASEAKKRNKLAQAITNSYTKAEPFSNRPAALGVIRKAVDSQRYSGEEINAAVLRIAADKRSLTVETLRVELDGFTPRTNGSHRTNRAPLRERLKGGAA